MRLRNGRQDSGAALAEWAATLVLVSVVLAALLASGVVATTAARTRAAICEIFGITGCGDLPYDVKPSAAACVTGSDSQKVGGSITVFDVKIGNSFQLVRTVTADGKVKIMVVPVDFKLGAEAVLGEKTAGGSFGVKAGAKVEGTANLKFGDTWVFDDKAGADHFVDDMKGDWLRYEAEKASPALWLFDKVTGWEPGTGTPQIQQVELSAEGVLSGSLGFGRISDSTGEKKIVDAGTGLEVEGKVGDSVAVTKDNSKPDDPTYPRTSYTFGVKGSVKGGAKALGFGTDGSTSYQGQTKVTFGKNGELLNITWVTTHEETTSAGYKKPGDQKVSGKGSDKKVSVTTTSIDFDDTNRETGRQWLQDNAFMMPFQAVHNAFDPSGAYRTTDPGPSASALDRLLFERAKVSRTTYLGDVDEVKIEVKVGAEVTFGFDAGWEHEKQFLTGSEYLGPPSGGVRDFLKWPECTS
ncbi:MAG: hypothetical protein ABIS86_17705 [Streptosporangiaceae bacterium]